MLPHANPSNLEERVENYLVNNRGDLQYAALTEIDKSVDMHNKAKTLLYQYTRDHIGLTASPLAYAAITVGLETLDWWKISWNFCNYLKGKNNDS